MALESCLFAYNSAILARRGKENLSLLHMASDGVVQLWLENTSTSKMASLMGSQAGAVGVVS